MPQAVQRMTLETPGAGHVHAQWPPAPHATRYRVQMRTSGAEVFENAATVHEPETMLMHLPSGQSLEFRVIAANAAGEAAPSMTAMVRVQ